MSTSYPLAPSYPDAMDILGLPLHRVAPADIHAYIEETIQRKEKALILNLNIHCVALALRHSWLREFLRFSQLVFCDGDGVRWGIRLLGEKPPPKIPFTRWLWDLAAFCERKGFSLYFLGARPGIAQEAAVALRQRFPALKIVGTHHGYFDHTGKANEEVINEINRLKPDLLIVGFGMPLQEQWLCKNWSRIDAHALLPAGAVFDYAAGRLGHVPPWMIRTNLEWLYRVWQEPRRLFGRYVTEIPYFFWHVLRAKLRQRRRSC